MAAFTSVAAGIGLAATATTTGMSFAQTAKQRKLQLQAQEASKEFMAKARKRFDVNYYDALSVPREPYELQRDAMLASGAQAIEAAKESNRGVAATAGRVAMAQNEGQGQVRAAMNQDLMNLERLSAQEDSRLRDIKGQLDLEEVAGAQLAQANAWNLEQKAWQQGLAGVGAMAGQIAALPPLYGKESTKYAGQNQVTGKNGIETDGNAMPTSSTIPTIPAGMTGVSAPLIPNNGAPITPIEGVNQYNVQTEPVETGFMGVPPAYNGRNINPMFANKSLQDIQADLIQRGIIPAGEGYTVDDLAKYIYL